MHSLVLALMFKPCCKRWEFQLMNWGESWDICSGICCTQGCISNKVSPPHCGSYSHCCWLDWLLLVLGSDSMCPLMSVIISVINHYNETNFYSGFFFFKTEALHEHNIQDACLWYGTNENKIHEFRSLPTR
ncbi:hypothetical protein NC653_012023 [Populus alba x Populus x berolinensis]|uniref:Uncharacterized protein n=1 Tax=Populus alba x Populus x berolinensis TaxID=444605 RepID=A0AAD6W8N3_9ROSI|nr:hypothetical protein NC653_012023 [Populus alba x Populus x berolinensis]